VGKSDVIQGRERSESVIELWEPLTLKSSGFSNQIPTFLSLTLLSFFLTHWQNSHFQWDHF